MKDSSSWILLQKFSSDIEKLTDDEQLYDHFS